MPDILIFYNSFTIGIELKAGTKTSPVQEEMFTKLEKAGVHVDVAHCLFDIEEILNIRGIPMRSFQSYGYPSPKSRRPQKPAKGTTGTAA